MTDCLILKTALLAGIILLTVILLIVIIVRRIKSKRKIRRMCESDKIQVLNELAEPFGFYYIWKEDIFTSCVDSWQRKEGYEALYDKMASCLNIVMDALPVYFDYEGNTWLIELWKGQYGINTGGEVGVYRAKGIVPKIFYPAAHFDAVSNEEMPLIKCMLERKGKRVYTLERQHWWLTGFRMGTFSRPKKLRMTVDITFCDSRQAQAFYKGLEESGIPGNRFCIRCNEVYVRMDCGKRVHCLEKLHRVFVQLQNRFNCWLYRVVTCPFVCTVDRMLFLYYQLPFCFRHMLRLKRYRRPRRYRKKNQYQNGGRV